MTSVLSREQVRRVDQVAIQQFGMAGVVLMENAARGVADVLVAEFFDGQSDPPRTYLLCGKGNNAGDGYAIARHLDNRGYPVTIVQLVPERDLGGDALENWKIAQASQIPTIRLDGSSRDHLRAKLSELLKAGCFVIDCMLGTGAVGEPRFPFDVAIEVANCANARRIAVDIPTGLDCDSGIAAGHCFRAELTCTFVAAKPGFSRASAQDYLGHVQVIDIGVPRKILEQIEKENDVAE